MAGPSFNTFEVELLTTQYSTVLELLLQQKTSKLRGLCGSGSYVGKQASPVQQMGPLEYKAPTGRFSAIVPQEPNFTRRWVFPTDRELPVMIDEFDQLKTIVDPKSTINMGVMAAAGRFFDDLLINCAFATAQTGVDSSSQTAETWPALTYLVADTFGAGASTGMNYPKFIEAKRLLRHFQNDLDAEPPFAVIGSQQEADLLKQQEVMSKEYLDRPVVEDGNITRLAGFNIIVSERLNTSSSNTLRNCIFGVRSGLHLGIWKDMDTRISQRIDLSGQPWQLYSMISAGATRTQLGKVIQVNAADTTGADPTAP